MRTTFAIGVYKLNDPIKGLSGLVEFSANEYETMGRQFVGEKNYNAPPVMFLGRERKLALQTVNGKICKIASYVVLKDQREADDVAMETLKFCYERLGTPTEQKTGLFVWDAVDCNVVLLTGETAEGFCISLFLTSRSIRNLTLTSQAIQNLTRIKNQLKSSNDMKVSMNIVFMTNVATIVALLALWTTGRLSWPTGIQVFILWLLVPFGITWSLPGGRIHRWRTVVSLLVIQSVALIISNFESAMIGPLVVYVVAAGGLAWLAKAFRGTKFAGAYALLLNSGAAYSIGFSLEILLLELMGDIPGGQPWPVYTWAMIAITAFAIGGLAKPSGLVAAVPCWICAALMITFGVLQKTDAIIYSGIATALVGALVLVLTPRVKLRS